MPLIISPRKIFQSRKGSLVSVDLPHYSKTRQSENGIIIHSQIMIQIEGPSRKKTKQQYRNGMSKLAAFFLNLSLLLHVTAAQTSHSHFSLQGSRPTFLRSNDGKPAEYTVDLVGTTKVNLSFVPGKMEFGLRQSFQTMVSTFLSAHLGHMEQTIQNLEALVYIQEYAEDDSEIPSSLGLSTLGLTLDIKGQFVPVSGKIERAEDMDPNFDQLCTDVFNLHSAEFVKFLKSVDNKVDENYFSFVESLEAFVPIRVVGAVAVQMSFVTGKMDAEVQKAFLSVVTPFLSAFLRSSEQPISEIDVYVLSQEPIEDEGDSPSDDSLVPLLVSLEINGQFIPSKDEDMNPELGKICADIFDANQDIFVEQLRGIEADTGLGYFSSVEAADVSTVEQPTVSGNSNRKKDGPPAILFFGIGAAFGVALLIILVIALFAWDRTVVWKESSGSRGSRTLSAGSSGDTEENTPADYFDQASLAESGKVNQDSASSDATSSRSSKNVTIVYQGKNASPPDVEDEWAGSIDTDYSESMAARSFEPESLVASDASTRESRELQLLTSIQLAPRSPQGKQESRASTNQQSRSLVDAMVEESSEESNSIVDSYVSEGAAGTSSIISDQLQPTRIQSVFSAKSMYDGGGPVEVVRKDVMAPPGKLGIVVDTSVNGPIVVRVKPGSPVLTLVDVGDIIVAINDVDTRALTADSISDLMVRSEHIKRKLSLISGIDASPVLSMDYTG
mmetsp:Transcript_8979/g.12740  ORF Transcript_8979/g.12740 Transcript_8979/m.12740 type:complete len:729 (+) Transcript_8979:201-2387(+)